jgi:Ni2+-binding GTPase involved in maturation of urease and hydrogenase
MQKLQLHLVGGFLGSGKTTAIIQAARSLMAQGKKVGVVTNDQGKYLVDTAFFRLGDVPAVEVTGGCFCCNYDDLDARLDQIRDEVQPDVVFAESVGSCGDLVATVIKPLLELRESEFQPASFSVFSDCRMLNAHLNGDGLPFSDNVVYIFEKQIEEAGILVINKVDLMQPAAVETLVASARARFPGMPVLAQSSLDPHGLQSWLEAIKTGVVPLPEKPLAMDYQRYGDGEAQLAWLDEEVTLQVPDGQGKDVVTRLVDAVRFEIREHQAAIGHLKFLVQGGGAQAKISFTTLSDGEDGEPIPAIPGRQVSLLVNARVEMPAEELHNLLDRALERVSASMNSGFSTTGVSYFHPRYPTPTHRMV